MKKIKTLSVQVGDIIFYDLSKKRWVLQLEGVLQLGGIRYILFALDKLCYQTMLSV